MQPLPQSVFLVLQHFHHPERNPVLTGSTPDSLPPLPATGSHSSTSVSLDLLILDISYRWEPYTLWACVTGFFSLNLISSEFLHCVAWISTYLLLLSNTLPLYMLYLSIHHFIDIELFSIFCLLWIIWLQLSSVAQSCPTLCDPTDCSTPGLPVHHQLPEFTPTHVHWVGKAIQPASSSSVFPFSFCLQSFPASGSFPTSQFITSGGQSYSCTSLF